MDNGFQAPLLARFGVKFTSKRRITRVCLTPRAPARGSFFLPEVVTMRTRFVSLVDDCSRGAARPRPDGITWRAEDYPRT